MGEFLKGLFGVIVKTRFGWVSFLGRTDNLTANATIVRK